MTTTQQPQPTPPAARTAPAPWWWMVLVIFGATIIWGVRFGLSYLLVPTACELGDWILHVVSIGAIVLGAGATAVNLLLLKRPMDVATRFALLFGAGLNVFFLAVIVLEASTVFLVDACAKGAIP